MSFSNVDDDDFFFGETQKITSDEKTYESLSLEQVMQRQEAAIQQLKPLLGDAVNPRILLNHYRYDAMRALNDWMEDQDRVCKKVGLPPPDSEPGIAKNAPNQSCSICFDESDDVSSIPVLACKHFFCMDCWHSYLGIEVKEKRCLVTCPGRDAKGGKCTMVVDDAAILQILDKEEKAKYVDTMVQSFVDANENYKWCPAKNCKYAVFVKEFTSEFKNESILCKCGHFFCFNCTQGVHQPASCNMIAEWRKKNTGGDESIDHQLIATISRPCPKCNIPVEKNGGCNHMSCSRCQYHFCWQCMGKFGNGEKGGNDGYASHKCNGYFKEDADVLQKQEELKRFEFYNDRFNNHHKSMILEQKLLDNSEAFIQTLIAATGTSWISCQFYRDALAQLVLNRKALQNSYIFGYFRPLVCPYVNKLIFENLQLELERHTEKLANLVETQESAKDVIDKQAAISHQMKIAASVGEALLNSANEWVEVPDKVKDDKSTNKRGHQATKNKSAQLTKKNADKRAAEKAKGGKKQTEKKKRKSDDEDDELADYDNEEDNSNFGFEDEDEEMQRVIQASLMSK